MSLDLSLKDLEFNFNVTNSGQHKVYEFEGFRLDAEHRLLYRNGTQVSLTPKAVETLIALIERRGEVVSKQELMDEIWADTIVEESNLSQYLHVLRKTLGETSDGKAYIETLKRRGYRFNGIVRVVKRGNGRSTQTEFAEDPDQRKVLNSSSLNFESRGNLALSGHSGADRETHQSVNVERLGNIYSVSDWRRRPVADTTNAAVTSIRSKWASPLLVVVLVAGFAGILFGIYKVTTRGQNSEARSVPFRGSDITRLTTSGISKCGRDLAGRALCCPRYERHGRRQPLGTPGRCRKRHANCWPVAKRACMGHIRAGR